MKNKKEAPVIKYVGVKELAKTYCVTIPKIRKELMRLGFMDLDGKPTSKEFSTSNEGDVYPGTYYRYRKDIVIPELDRVFGDVSQASQDSYVQNRFQAEKKICNAIAKIGELCMFDRVDENSPDALLKHCHLIYSQAKYEDPHFMGGPCSIIYADTALKVDELISLYQERTRNYLISAVEVSKALGVESSVNHQLEVLDKLIEWVYKLY